MGGLINGITIKEIFKGISSSRNPNLANIFYRLGYVEAFGTGIGRIMDSYELHDKKPIFDVTENTFYICLPNINYDESKKINTVSSFSSQEDIIINYLNTYSKINRNETEKLLNVSKTRAYEILNSMLERKLIKKESYGKNTYYTIK